MTAISYPAAGIGGMTVEFWRNLFGPIDGIYGDYDQANDGAFSVTVNDASNTLTIGDTGDKVMVDGYMLELTAPHAVTVSTAAAKYWIVAQYDPALNVDIQNPANPSDPDDRIANPLGPVRLIVTSGTPSTADGKNYTTLYRFDRAASQALSDAFATREDRRRWVAGVMHVYNVDSDITGYRNWPRGQIALESSTGDLKVWERAPGMDTTGWNNRTSPPSVLVSVPGALVAQDTTARVWRNGSGVIIQGTLKRSNGARLTSGSDCVLGTVPAGYRPGGTVRRPCAAVCDAGRRFVSVAVESDGKLTLQGDSVTSPVQWVDLSGLTGYRIEN